MDVRGDDSASVKADPILRKRELNNLQNRWLGVRVPARRISGVESWVYVSLDLGYRPMRNTDANRSGLDTFLI